MRAFFAIVLAGCANGVQVERTVSPAEAARVSHPHIVAIEHDGQIKNVPEAIGVFGRDDGAYLLTTSGHIPLSPGDRLRVSGYYTQGEEVPGGGVVAHHLNVVMLSTGIFLTATGVGVIIAGIVVGAQRSPPCPDTILDYCGFGSGFKGLAATGIIFLGAIPLTAGLILTAKSFGQPAVIDRRHGLWGAKLQSSR